MKFGHRRHLNDLRLQSQGKQEQVRDFCDLNHALEPMGSNVGRAVATTGRWYCERFQIALKGRSPSSHLFPISDMMESP